MLKNKWRKGLCGSSPFEPLGKLGSLGPLLALSFLISPLLVLSQNSTPSTPSTPSTLSNPSKSPSNESSNFRINDLLNNEKALKSSDGLKADTPNFSPLPPSIPPSGLPFGNPSAGSDPNNINSDHSNRPQTMDLVGIYYAKEVQKAEIIIGGFSHYYSEGDRLSSKWVLKNIEPSHIELERCKEKTKRCEFKTIEFTPSVRD